MKWIERNKARTLRTQGHSINEIVRLLGVTKSSVSLWVRDVELTASQKKRLSERGHTLESIEQRRTKRLKNERARRMPIFEKAASGIGPLSKKSLMLVGAALYWGEGAKTKRGKVDFTNSDPRSIQLMMLFFRKVCEVPEAKFRGHVILHPHLNALEAERYWSALSGIPASQFYKSSQQHNKASKGKKDSLPLGTFSININDTQLYLRIMGWIEGLYMQAVPGNLRVPCRYHEFL